MPLPPTMEALSAHDLWGCWSSSDALVHIDTTILFSYWWPQLASLWPRLAPYLFVLGESWFQSPLFSKFPVSSRATERVWTGRCDMFMCSYVHRNQIGITDDLASEYAVWGMTWSICFDVHGNHYWRGRASTTQWCFRFRTRDNPETIGCSVWSLTRIPGNQTFGFSLICRNQYHNTQPDLFLTIIWFGDPQDPNMGDLVTRDMSQHQLIPGLTPQKSSLLHRI